jgi:hypothetical protein
MVLTLPSTIRRSGNKRIHHGYQIGTPDNPKMPNGVFRTVSPSVHSHTNLKQWLCLREVAVAWFALKWVWMHGITKIHTQYVLALATNTFPEGEGFSTHELEAGNTLCQSFRFQHLRRLKCRNYNKRRFFVGLIMLVCSQCSMDA